MRGERKPSEVPADTECRSCEGRGWSRSASGRCVSCHGDGVQHAALYDPRPGGGFYVHAGMRAMCDLKRCRRPQDHGDLAGQGGTPSVALPEREAS